MRKCITSFDKFWQPYWWWHAAVWYRMTLQVLSEVFWWRTVKQQKVPWVTWELIRTCFTMFQQGLLWISDWLVSCLVGLWPMTICRPRLSFGGSLPTRVWERCMLERLDGLVASLFWSWILWNCMATHGYSYVLAILCVCERTTLGFNLRWPIVEYLLPLFSLLERPFLGFCHVAHVYALAHLDCEMITPQP